MKRVYEIKKLNEYFTEKVNDWQKKMSLSFLKFPITFYLF